MNTKFELLKTEHVASIRDIQKNPSKMLRGITRVMKGSVTHGFFFSNSELEELFEDIEMANSPKIKQRIREARKELKKGKLKTYTPDELLARYEN